jgi:hypothetical protein
LGRECIRKKPLVAVKGAHRLSHGGELKYDLCSRYTVLPALSLEGVIHLDIFNGSVTAEIFNQFARQLVQLMNPWPGRNSVLVIDNASIHHSAELEQIIAARCVVY